MTKKAAKYTDMPGSRHLQALIPSPSQIAWRARLFNSPFSHLN
jgi:hypothetical protein